MAFLSSWRTSAARMFKVTDYPISSVQMVYKRHMEQHVIIITAIVKNQTRQEETCVKSIRYVCIPEPIYRMSKDQIDTLNL